MGHADFEIEALFDKFDVDGDRILNEEEVAAMKEELEEDEVMFYRELLKYNKHKSPRNFFLLPSPFVSPLILIF